MIMINIELPVFIASRIAVAMATFRKVSTLATIQLKIRSKRIWKYSHWIGLYLGVSELPKKESKNGPAEHWRLTLYKLQQVAGDSKENSVRHASFDRCVHYSAHAFIVGSDYGSTRRTSYKTSNKLSIVRNASANIPDVRVQDLRQDKLCSFIDKIMPNCLI